MTVSDIKIKDVSSVAIAPDKMSATMNLSPKADNSQYTSGEIYDFLRSHGVNSGYIHSAIDQAIEKALYGIPIVIAKGTPAVDGSDGFFEYKFRTKIDTSPTILPDGSVDYRAKDNFEPINSGDIIAVYHDATHGTDGIDVRGMVIKAKNGKDLNVLKGNGFKMDEDGHTYRSVLSGKIELKNDVIEITNVLEISGDVDMAYGDINFDGDVLIHGAILHGTTVKATGDIFVDGNVEDAFLFSEKNIELKSGMQGMGRGSIECNGNLSGKFFESTIIRCNGSLNANSLLNCDSFVRGRVTISGKRGVILGGTTTAMSDIIATTVGNLTELKTFLIVGITPEYSAKLLAIEEEITEIKERIEKLDLVLMKIIKIGNPTDKAKLEQKRALVMYSKNELMKSFTEKNSELKDMLKSANATSYSTVNISKYIFPGTNICINGARLNVTTDLVNVTLKSTADNKVEIINNVM